MKGHARNIMTAPVVSVGPEASLEEIARCLAAARIGGVPVVGAEGHVEGFVVGVRYAREDRLLNRLLASDPEALLPYLTTNGELVVAAARDFLVRQAPEVPAADRTPAGVAEVFVRLAISFTLMPGGAIPLDTDDDVRAFARGYLAPLMRPGG